ncbi:putative L-PSP endoribonuclease family protein Brt1 [Aspergillus tamarii]|uniref:Putative L-PSP endoribonuclease family protein Brt1 n=1 Tax=Aspergillus tamarii TaxID=41984 RepID=A0A5N6UCB1_ASPTM|nr:putative L-PSP endoribonuclease family protein Brt1 [Aspergillus tamarii]
MYCTTISSDAIYCSGAVTLYPETGKIDDGDIKAHTHQCIKNLSHILEAADSDIMKVLMVKVFLSDMDNFAEMNSIYIQYRGDVKPCRTCICGCKTIPLNTNMEIEPLAAV